MNNNREYEAIVKRLESAEIEVPKDDLDTSKPKNPVKKKAQSRGLEVPEDDL